MLALRGGATTTAAMQEPPATLQDLAVSVAEESPPFAVRLGECATQSHSIYQHLSDRRAVLRALAAGNDELRVARESLILSESWILRRGSYSKKR